LDARRIALAGLAAAPGMALTRVQAQKLYFLIDRQLADRLDGPAFNFVPYHYGPYDKNVYRILEELAVQGLVALYPSGARQTFQLTPRGEISASRELASLPQEVSRHIVQLATWVRTLSFSDLITAIYRAYPEMRANSVFQP
jgi:uncharacterized protein